MSAIWGRKCSLHNLHQQINELISKKKHKIVIHRRCRTPGVHSMNIRAGGAAGAPKS